MNARIVPRLTLGVLLVAGILAPATSWAAVEDLEIEYMNLTIRRTFVLRARFDPQDMPVDFDPWEDEIGLRLNNIPVMSSPGPRPWSYTVRGLGLRIRQDGESRVRMRLNLGTGEVKVRVRNLNIDELDDLDHMTFRLTLNGTEFTGAVTTEFLGLRFRYRGKEAPKPGDRIALRVLARHTNANMDLMGIQTARNAEELEVLWGLIHSIDGFGSAPPIPEVDFETEMAVAVILGPRPYQGFRVKALRARECGGGARLTVRETRPGGGGIRLPAMTYPWTLVAIPRREGPVTAVCRFRVIR